MSESEFEGVPAEMVQLVDSASEEATTGSNRRAESLPIRVQGLHHSALFLTPKGWLPSTFGGGDCKAVGYMLGRSSMPGEGETLSAKGKDGIAEFLAGLEEAIEEGADE